MTRYDNLFQALNEIAGRGVEHLGFLEVGTYDGVRTASLLRYWLAGAAGRTGSYFGFDLWEQLTPALSKRELSKSRLPPAMYEVEARLRDTGITTLRLFQGNTLETLPRVVEELPTMDLIFQDGGHSLETAASDWAHASKLMRPGTVYLLDDYYRNKPGYGCKELVDGLTGDPRYKVSLLDPLDTMPGTGLEICFARVELAG